MKLKFSIVLLVLLSLFVTEKSWTGQERSARPTLERIRRVENGLIPLDQNRQPAKLADRMQFYKVPGVSVAVVSRGEIQWARGYGVLENGNTKP